MTMKDPSKMSRGECWISQLAPAIISYFREDSMSYVCTPQEAKLRRWLSPVHPFNLRESLQRSRNINTNLANFCNRSILLC